MKVKFPYFGDDTDYLKFTIADIEALEMATGKSVFKLMSDDDFGAMFVFKALPIAYKHCHPELDDKTIRDKVQECIDEGGSLIAIIGALVMALYKSGIYGKQEKPVTSEDGGKK